MNFVTINFETAGYSPKNACSLGMVKYRDGKKIDTFYSLIKPPELYSRSNFAAIHGLTVDDIKNAPTFAELWESKILPFIDDLPLAAHNANFDIGVLLSLCEFYELYNPKLQYFCSLQLARSMWPSMKSYTLSALAKEFDIAYIAHNTLDKAETCGKIVLRAAQEFHSASLKNLLSIAEIDMNMIGGISPLTQREINQLLYAIGAETDDDDTEICDTCPLTKNAVPLGTIDIVYDNSDDSGALDFGDVFCFGNDCVDLSEEDPASADDSEHSGYDREKDKAIRKLDRLKHMSREYRDKALDNFPLKDLESLMLACPLHLSDVSEEDKDIFRALKYKRWHLLNQNFGPTQENILRVVEVSNQFLKAWEDGFAKAKKLLEAIYEKEQDKEFFMDRYIAEIRLDPEIWYKNSETDEWEIRDDIYDIMMNYWEKCTLAGRPVRYDPAKNDEKDFFDNINVSRKYNWAVCTPMPDFFHDHYLCYAIHELWDHEDWAFQDIAMINNISVYVEIKYSEQERRF